ncbi:hypothetical protein IFM89_024536 [Coptis chinensis]|uniref:Pentatricopeptide repeat-containing protein n=1 Tax=Coptis chinensis TaxID=261450 RepID=A0A835LNX6_9MAGN|nr:hypothetical protein IFM89_024536 [Coptis chinensis]
MTTLRFRATSQICGLIMLCYQSMAAVERLFKELGSNVILPDAITYNSLLYAFAREGNVGKQGQHDLAFHLYKDMKSGGRNPDAITYNVLIDSLGKAGKITEVTDVMSGMLDAGIKPTLRTFSALIYGYAKAGMWVEVEETFNYMVRFVGVSCWNEQENRLIALELRSFELGGEVPPSLQFCQSLQTLDLSDNALSGSIPSQLCDWLPFLVKIDLSKNQFTGSIPAELVNCKFLNSLSLGGNRLSGSIPYQLARLNRLKTLSVPNNDLSGQIPSFLSNFDSAGFEGNKRLCGRPLKSKCGGG